MSTLDIRVTVTIKTDDRYCDENCHYHKPAPSIAFPAWCRLFGRPCEHCLGGGPLRCPECEAAEKATKKKK